MTAVRPGTRDVRALRPEWHGCVTPRPRRVAPQFDASAVIVGTGKTGVRGPWPWARDRVAVGRECRHGLDQHVDPPVLDLQPAVDHEQGMPAHLESPLHHWGTEDQVEM